LKNRQSCGLFAWTPSLLLGYAILSISASLGTDISTSCFYFDLFGTSVSQITYNKPKKPAKWVDL
jgi:hypothetical protein